MSGAAERASPARSARAPRGATGAFLCLAGLSLLASCELVDGSGVQPLAAPSRDAFADEAGPLLEKRCADVGCHGDAERPFALFAVGSRRADASQTYSREPLTEQEVDANYDATRGFLDAELALDTTLLRKALGVGGPGGHLGGAVFEARSDPECRAIMRWIEGEPP